MVQGSFVKGSAVRACNVNIREDKDWDISDLPEVGERRGSTRYRIPNVSVQWMNGWGKEKVDISKDCGRMSERGLVDFGGYRFKSVRFYSLSGIWELDSWITRVAVLSKKWKEKINKWKWRWIAVCTGQRVHCHESLKRPGLNQLGIKRGKTLKNDWSEVDEIVDWILVKTYKKHERRVGYQTDW